jgi:23S rRNA pseudouridine1911/1915/1917 synthase
MDTHGFSGADVNTLANFIVGRRPETFGVGKSVWEPGLVHRLDRETSGLVLIAKTQPVFERLRLQFRERRVKKRYWALVWGVTREWGTIDYAIAHDPRDRRRMRAVIPSLKGSRAEAGRAALTHYKRISSDGRFTLLEVEISTGAMHQIRVHLAAAGHAIVGDVTYGQSADRLGLNRHFLHAHGLEFDHPADERRVGFESPLPTELTRVLNRLKMAPAASPVSKAPVVGRRG